MIKTETLSIPDLPPKVRYSLEAYLQHREQMSGRRCTGVTVTNIIVTHETSGADAPDETRQGLHPHDPDYESPARRAGGDEDPTPWAV